MMKIVRMLPVLSLALGFSSHASADVDWSLKVKFSDGAIARGTFITNDAGTELESWKVHVRKGLEAHDFVSQSNDGVSTPDDFGKLTFTPVSWPTGTVEALEFGDFGSGAYSIFYLGNLLTGEVRTGDDGQGDNSQGDNSQGDNSQGDNSGEDGHPVKIIGAIDCGKSDCGALQMGSIIDPPLPDPPLDPAPEPISIILLCSVVVFISGALRRRAKNRVA